MRSATFPHISYLDDMLDSAGASGGSWLSNAPSKTNKVRTGLWLVALVILLCSAGCVFSQQSGKPFHHATDAKTLELGNISFHFRGAFNYFTTLMRLALLAGLLWTTRQALRKESRQHIAVLALLLALCGGATWLFSSSAVTVAAYRIDVNKSRLSVRIPFQADLKLRWEEILNIRVAGHAVSMKRRLSGNEPLYNKWRSLEIVATNGRGYKLQLTRLTVVQRSNLVEAIQHRSGMARARIPLLPRLP